MTKPKSTNKSSNKSPDKIQVEYYQHSDFSGDKRTVTCPFKVEKLWAVSDDPSLHAWSDTHGYVDLRFNKDGSITVYYEPPTASDDEPFAKVEMTLRA